MYLHILSSIPSYSTHRYARQLEEQEDELEMQGEIISDEARALNNLGGCRHRNSKEGCNWHDNWFIGLNVWVPNLNIYRDPRW